MYNAQLAMSHKLENRKTKKLEIQEYELLIMITL